jgi:hypoxanthine phosphoribosyltransferase
MFIWNWIKEKIKLRTIQSVLYFLTLTALGEIAWTIISNTFEKYTLLKAIGFLLIIIAAIFAAVWYLSRQASGPLKEQKTTPAGQGPAQVSYKIPSDTQGEILLEDSPPWEQVYNGVKFLSELISKRDKDIDMIVGISSGGATIAGMLSRLLNIPYTQIVRSKPQREETEPDKSAILSVPIDIIRNKSLLLVDDIVVLGGTLKRCCDELEKLGIKPSDIKCAALLVVGERWEREPDYYVFRASKELRMPWDFFKVSVEVTDK